MGNKYTAEQLAQDQLRDLPKTLMETIAAIMDGNKAVAVSGEDVQSLEVYIDKEHEMRIVANPLHTPNGHHVLVHGDYTVCDLETGDELFAKEMMVVKYVDHAIVYPELYIMDWGK